MARTESFGRGRIAESILDTTSVPFTLKVSSVPVEDNQFITINPDSTSEEIFFYTTKTGTSGDAGTLNVTGRGYNVNDDTQVVGNQKQHDENSEYKLALNHIIINDKMDLVLDNVVLSEIGFGNTLKTGLTVNNLTTVERDALTPANGAIIYNTTDNVNQQYVGGAWSDVGDTGTADASETVAGKVEMATQAEYDARTATGGTGALLVPQMGQLPIAATTTTEGLVELATDAEALAGTDETRYINSKQAKDNYEVVYPGVSVTYFTDAGGSTANTSFTTIATYTATANGVYLVQYTASRGNNFSGEVRILVDGIQLNTYNDNNENIGILGSLVSQDESLTLTGQVGLGIGVDIVFQALTTDASKPTTISGITIKGDR